MLKVNRDSWFKKRTPIEETIIDLRQYRLVFLGSPIWWYQPAPPPWIFVENNNLNGKNVVLFNTFDSRFKQDDIEDFKNLVEDHGGKFLNHVYIRRGRIYKQLSGKDLILEPQHILDKKEQQWRSIIQKI